jgi:hypothetical protein
MSRKVVGAFFLWKDSFLTTSKNHFLRKKHVCKKMLRILKERLMMRLQVHSFQLPRWVAPVMILIALALIPFALVLGLALTTIAIGFSALRLFLPISNSATIHRTFNGQTRMKNHTTTSGVIDAEYQVKEKDGKN